MLARQGMSKRAFGALKTIVAEPIPFDDVGLYADTTLYPLFARHEIAVTRKNGSAYISATKEGVAALSEYTHAKIPERKYHKGQAMRPVTHRTAAYLRMIRLRKAS
jgi:hypothetical protein